jgi:hypothetical protein
MSTGITTIRGHEIPATARRASWLAWAAFLLAFAVLEGVNHGAAAWAGGPVPRRRHFACWSRRPAQYAKR